MSRCASVLIPVLRHKFARGWPEHEVGGRAWYAPVARAFTSAYSTDAHFAAYSVPNIRRRLATVFVFCELLGGVPMVLYVVDVEPPGHAPVTTEWWQIELAKIKRMLADHPGGFIYRTRGGYRIVFLLREPVVLASEEDAAHWSATYLAWLKYTSDRYGIVGDQSCRDWTRLYRLPRVIRDGERQEPVTIGDAAEIGPWTVAVTVPDSQAPHPRMPINKGFSANHPGRFAIDLFMASKYPGVTSSAVLGGRRWDIECPWQHEHSSKSGRETAVFAGDDGRLGFHCFHDHCADREWQDFRKWHEPGYVRQDTPTADAEHSTRVAAVQRMPRETLEYLIADRRIYRLIVDGPEGDADHSDAVWRVCCRLIRLGIDDDTITGIITDSAYGIARHVRAAPRAIERAHQVAWGRR